MKQHFLENYKNKNAELLIEQTLRYFASSTKLEIDIEIVSEITELEINSETAVEIISYIEGKRYLLFCRMLLYKILII